MNIINAKDEEIRFFKDQQRQAIDQHEFKKHEQQIQTSPSASAELRGSMHKESCSPLRPSKKLTIDSQTSPLKTPEKKPQSSLEK